jgi:acetyl esterase/lipase
MFRMVKESHMAEPTMPVEIPLWPQEPPFAFPPDADERITERPARPGRPGPNRSVEYVSMPTLAVHTSARPNGTAMLVYPGGGYRYLEIDKEGHHIAAWLARAGITAAVVKYRTCPPSRRQEGRPMPPEIFRAILADGLRAVRLMRHRAPEWDIAPDRIGVMGFSAGGHLVAHLATGYDEADPVADEIGAAGARPDFVAPIYPGIREEVAARVNAQTPPAFLCGVDDDTLTPPENCLRFYSACRAANVPAELHIFRAGRHGFGLGEPGQPVTMWQEMFIAWLRGMGMM